MNTPAASGLVDQFDNESGWFSVFASKMLGRLVIKPDAIYPLSRFRVLDFQPD
jgi:hypothetical protein